MILAYNGDYMTEISDQQIDNIRQFNRFYTRQIGLLNEGLYKSQYTLAEARIIYELGEVEHALAKNLAQSLSLDAGYLSRILNKLIKVGLVLRSPNIQDKRQQLLSLSPQGHGVKTDLRHRSVEQVRGLYNNIIGENAQDLVSAMTRIQALVEGGEPAVRTYILRDPEVGDLSYITHRQAVLYNLEYGFGDDYEGLVSAVIGDYIANNDPKYEKCWIAECDGQVVGSIFCVKGGDDVAKLRLLYVDPSARGMGLGGKLIEEVIKFSRKTGYKTLEFWTVDCLTDAKRLYEKAGFELVASQPHEAFGTAYNGGKGVNRQDWRMTL